MENITLTRQELFNLVWTEPMLALSRKFNISDTGLRKICLRMKVPLPQAGHWQKLKFGKKVKRFALPIIKGQEEVVSLKLRNEDGTYTIPEPSPIMSLQKEMEAFFAQTPDKSSTPQQLGKHAMTLKKVLQAQTPDSREYLGAVWGSRETLDTRVTKAIISRTVYFWDSLVKALEIRGHAVNFRNGETYATILQHDFHIMVREKFTIERVKEGIWERRIFHPTGILSLQIKGWPPREWKDAKVPIEQQLPAILAWLEVQGKEKQADRLEFERKAEERKRKERLRQAFEKQQEEELNGFKEMLAKASRWHKATNLLNYIQEIETRQLFSGKDDEKLTQWLQWAKAKADWYDPFMEVSDEWLDEIDRTTLAFPKRQTGYGYF